MTIEFVQQLLEDFIIVQMAEEVKSTIKLTQWQRTLRGTVLAAGPGKLTYKGTRLPMTTQVGDLVTFAATAGMDSSYGAHVRVRMMRDSDVDAVLEEVAV